MIALCVEIARMIAIVGILTTMRMTMTRTKKSRRKGKRQQKRRMQQKMHLNTNTKVDWLAEAREEKTG